MIAKFESLPDHTQLPDSDGAIVENFQEHPEALLLTDCILPLLRQRHPDDQFCIGSNSGIYWQSVDPPLDGCKAPDWYYVPGVSPTVDGEPRRSYVLWRELIAPRVLIEFVSGDGEDERDRTPWRGKFWVYENVLHSPYYVIYEVDPGRVEVYRLIDGVYRLVEANERGHYPVACLDVELGIWHGTYLGMDLPWLRWWDSRGELLLMGAERAEREKQRADKADQRADKADQRADEERQRADKADQRADKADQRADKADQRADEERQRADEERQRAERLAARLREMGVDLDQQ